jgi:hypothetical protein
LQLRLSEKENQAPVAQPWFFWNTRRFTQPQTFSRWEGIKWHRWSTRGRWGLIWWRHHPSVTPTAPQRSGPVECVVCGLWYSTAEQCDFILPRWWGEAINLILIINTLEKEWTTVMNGLSPSISICWEKHLRLFWFFFFCFISCEQRKYCRVINWFHGSFGIIVICEQSTN